MPRSTRTSAPVNSSSKRVPVRPQAKRGTTAQTRSKGVKPQEHLYDVERILQKKIDNGRIYYQIKWLGWPFSRNTWEPESNLMETCKDVVTEFNEQNELLGIQPVEVVTNQPAEKENATQKSSMKRKSYPVFGGKRKKAKIGKADSKSSDQVILVDVDDNLDNASATDGILIEATNNDGEEGGDLVPNTPEERSVSSDNQADSGETVGIVDLSSAARTLQGDHGERPNNDAIGTSLGSNAGIATNNNRCRTAPPPRELVDYSRMNHKQLEDAMYDKPILVDYPFNNLPYTINNVIPLGSDVVYCVDLVDNYQEIQRRLMVGSTLRRLNPDLIIEYYEQRLGWVRDPLYSQKISTTIKKTEPEPQEPVQGPSRLSFPPQQFSNDNPMTRDWDTDEIKVEDNSEKTYLAPMRNESSYRESSPEEGAIRIRKDIIVYVDSDDDDEDNN